MKSINQFDYPSKQAQSYKIYSHEQLSDSKDKITSSKIRYKQNLQYHMELQRNNVKEAQKTKKQQEVKKKKEKLESQLLRKKQQLQNLQILKQQAEQNQKKSYELAAVKQQQDRIKKAEELKRKQQFDNEASIRFQEALKKLYQQKQSLAFKERLAQQRRKTAQEFQKVQRTNANKYKTFLQQKERNQAAQYQDSGVEVYKKTIKTFVSNPNPDYNRTCLHNLKVVPERNNQKPSAFQRGELQRVDLRQKSEQKKSRIESNQRRSKQRGKQALLRMQRQKQYQTYEKQLLEEQKKYNLDRIEAGKKDQFIGLKPTTLTQMQNNKKLRSEDEFNSIFYSNPQNSQTYQRPPTKFEIVEERHNEQNTNNNRSIEHRTKLKPNSYLKDKSETEMPSRSQGNYSFEQLPYSEFQNRSHVQQNQLHIEQNQLQPNQQQQSNHNLDFQFKNSLKETRVPEYNKKPFHNYQFESNPNPIQNSSHIQISSKHHNLIQKPMEKKEQSRFNAQEMLKKYGLKKEISGDKEPKLSNKNNNNPNEMKKNKRKVVELSSICQNSKNKNEELSYSSQSQEDSLM